MYLKMPCGVCIPPHSPHRPTQRRFDGRADTTHQQTTTTLHHGTCHAQTAQRPLRTAHTKRTYLTRILALRCDRFCVWLWWWCVVCKPLFASRRVAVALRYGARCIFLCVWCALVRSRASVCLSCACEYIFLHVAVCLSSCVGCRCVVLCLMAAALCSGASA